MKSKAFPTFLLLCLALISLSALNVSADIWSVDLRYEDYNPITTLVLDVSGFLCEGESLVVIFHDYHCNPLGNVIVFSGPTELYPINVTNPLGEGVKLVCVYKVEKSGDLTGLDVFVMRRSDLVCRLTVLDTYWIFGYPRQPIMKEIIQIDGQWPYAPA